ncbi:MULTISPECIES: phage virion morphogenesis protein [Brenneria]|uniref:Phage virion morphogenesis protein n=1 Tax=Brenneria nigrifluens DSM 30175 = ATCC 13028 TaxID=1121120 RepID=A0A2U1UQE6_9GAMM|nr:MULTISPECIES: phage virion morphogenesis protein [Brenneria]EHD23641.1 phage virion morphogenesis protein [Brenneria sp. EniD312]PWC23898.1 phage virion morphogenesis protein [Brenneria nigrifluens DSM 30175 = ATCC 13028]QCR06569.1 phage virion morphogenesis protein [Brenneria nigrifluens DSM 30175 = ATCC 13028]
MSDSDLFHQLDDVFNGILTGMSAQGRRASARAIAIAVRRSQQQRIARQQNPDGSQYEKRRYPIKKTHRRLRVVYRGDLRELVDWRHTTGRNNAKMVTGHDLAKGAERSFRRSDISAWLDIDLTETKKNATKKQDMFRRLRTSRWLRARSDTSGATIGFFGIAAYIARVHQFGLRDRVGGTASVNYPRRVLLGLNEADRRIIAEKMIESMRLS